ncbi:MAG: hypothetical protein WAN93_08715 [Solirubrobacteraceae bacterium]
MTLWHRAPREVYRVYGEDEYLAEGEIHAEGYAHAEGEVHAYSTAHVEEETRRSSLRGRAQGRRSQRLVGLGLLVGVAVGALGLVALNASHRPAVGSQPGFAHSADAPAARRPSTGALADPSPAVRMPTEAGSSRRKLAPQSAPAHQPFRPRLRAGSPINSAPSAALAETRELWPSASELSESDTASATDEEFNFER